MRENPLLPDAPTPRPERRDLATRFQKGNNMGPNGRGHTYGGRWQALDILDRMLAKDENQAILAQALEEEFRERPVKFFRDIVMPLLPQGVILQTTTEPGGRVVWTSLLSAPVAPSSNATPNEQDPDHAAP